MQYTGKVGTAFSSDILRFLVRVTVVDVCLNVYQGLVGKFQEVFVDIM